MDGRWHSRHWRAGSARLFFAAALASVALILPSGAPAAQAAVGDLDITSTATYTVQPANGRVQVAIAFRAVNLKPDTATIRYYYTSLSFFVQREARNLRVTGGHRITTKRSADFIRVDLGFESRLFYRQSTSFSFTYQLPGGAPRSTSTIRVGRAFVTFPAWAFSEHASVTITLPSDFDADTIGSPITKSTRGNRTVLSARNIRKPFDWFVRLTADRDAALTKIRITPEVAGDARPVVIRAWPEDRVWANRARDTLERGLPVLGELVGLDWPLPKELPVSEVYTPLLEGYAGFYLGSTQEILMSEELDHHLALHEASHVWFNDALFAERWITEGLAEAFAARASGRLGLEVEQPGDVDRTAKHAFPLAQWPDPEKVDDEETRLRERYGYDASFQLMEALIAMAGEERFREVLQAADKRQIAYVGAPDPEGFSGIHDWRYFLDLLEERASATAAVELVRTWVIAQGDEPRLRERSVARTAYLDLVAASGDWKPPIVIRRAMATWQFDQATRLVKEADEVITDAQAIAKVAESVDVSLPESVRSTYESVAVGFDDTRELLAGLRTAVDGQVDLVAAARGAADDLQAAAATDLVARLVADGAGQISIGDVQAASATQEAARETIEAARPVAVASIAYRAAADTVSRAGLAGDASEMLGAAQAALGRRDFDGARERAAALGRLVEAARPLAAAVEVFERESPMLSRAGLTTETATLIEKARAAIRSENSSGGGAELAAFSTLVEAARPLAAAVEVFERESAILQLAGLTGEPAALIDTARGAVVSGDAAAATASLGAFGALLDAARPVAAAADAVARERGVLTTVGLVGESPDAALAAAQAALRSGSLDNARAQAARASALIDGAESAGRDRVLAGSCLGAFVLVGVGGGAFAIRRRRRKVTTKAA